MILELVELSFNTADLTADIITTRECVEYIEDIESPEFLGNSVFYYLDKKDRVILTNDLHYPKRN